MKSIKDLSSNNETIIGPVKRIGNELWLFLHFDTHLIGDRIFPHELTSC
jgi:hypothetical protein